MELLPLKAGLCGAFVDVKAKVHNSISNLSEIRCRQISRKISFVDRCVMSRGILKFCTVLRDTCVIVERCVKFQKDSSTKLWVKNHGKL